MNRLVCAVAIAILAALLASGLSYSNEREPVATLEGLMAQLSDDPDDPRLMLAIGNLYAEADDHDQAMQWYDRASEHAVEVPCDWQAPADAEVLPGGTECGSILIGFSGRLVYRHKDNDLRSVPRARFYLIKDTRKAPIESNLERLRVPFSTGGVFRTRLWSRYSDRELFVDGLPYKMRCVLPTFILVRAAGCEDRRVQLADEGTFQTILLQCG